MGLTAGPAFWLFLMFLAGSVLVVGGEQLGYLATLPGAWFLSSGAARPHGHTCGLLIYRFDQFEPEPASMIAIAVICGGVW